MAESRSGEAAGAQLDWVGDLPSPGSAWGVGARQARSGPLAGGGGYLDECTIPDVWERAKIRELADMGLPRVWVRAAVAIGYDNFIALWRILDESIELRSESESMILVRLRRFASYKRYQRNRMVEALAAQGVGHDEIRSIVNSDLGEFLSLRHIERLANKGRLPS